MFGEASGHEQSVPSLISRNTTRRTPCFARRVCEGAPGGSGVTSSSATEAAQLIRPLTRVITVLRRQLSCQEGMFQLFGRLGYMRSMNSQIFREYDVRGLVDKDLTDAVVENLGKGLAT